MTWSWLNAMCVLDRMGFFFSLLLGAFIGFQQMKVKVCFDLYNMHNDCHVSLIGNFIFLLFVQKLTFLSIERIFLPC